MTARKTPAQDAATEVINQMQDAIEGKAAGTPLVVGVMLDDPFPKSLVGMLPRTSKRPAMEYVGHGAVTRRLLAVDPEWTWEPMGYASDGTAAVERDAQGRPIGL